MVLSFNTVEADVRTSVQSGRWSQSSTWQNGIIPVSGDTVVIQTPNVVEVDVNTAASGIMFSAVYIYGTLNFRPANKIAIADGGIVWIAPGGLVTGGNSGSKFEFYNLTGSKEYEIAGPFNVSGETWAGTYTYGWVYGPLPVSLISFTSTTNKNGSVELNWVTSSEQDNAYFQVERSTNGTEWLPCGMVQGNGTTQQIQSYTHTVSGLASGVVYFRLKQVDFSGKFEYSDIIAATITSPIEVSAYPNPVNGVLHVKTIGLHQAGQVVVLNSFGQIVLTTGLQAENSITELDLSLLTNGLYIVKVTSQETSAEIKVLKN